MADEGHGGSRSYSHPRTRADAFTEKHRRVWVAGLPVEDAGVGEALDRLWVDAIAGTPSVYALVNAYSASLVRESPQYASTLDDTRVVPLPDGAALIFGAWLTGQGPIGRCPGPDLFSAACARASSDGTAVFLVGGGPGVVERLRDVLETVHPGLSIAGIETPPMGDWDESSSIAICEKIRQSGARVVWLGVSAPKQEVWALRNVDAVGCPIVCVGAAFDFLSGAKPRAPKWMRALGFEWLFRLATEPRRLWKRYIVGNAVFMADLARYGAGVAHR